MNWVPGDIADIQERILVTLSGHQIRYFEKTAALSELPDTGSPIYSKYLDYQPYSK
ncbi:conserved domain protein [Paenibacillus sp. HGF5]|nr:conserved domain protein [Paenibacillus sp. HGF5]